MSHIPGKDDVAELLEMLVDQEVKASPGMRVLTSRPDHITVATYKTEEGDVLAACVMDLACSNALAAALTLVPPHQAKNFTKRQELPESAMENLHEVYNVASRWFHVEEQPHVILDKVYVFPREQEDQLTDKIKSFKDKAAYNLKLGDYGPGRIQLMRKAA